MRLLELLCLLLLINQVTPVHLLIFNKYRTLGHAGVLGPQFPVPLAQARLAGVSGSSSSRTPGLPKVGDHCTTPNRRY